MLSFAKAKIKNLKIVESYRVVVYLVDFISRLDSTDYAYKCLKL